MPSRLIPPLIVLGAITLMTSADSDAAAPSSALDFEMTSLAGELVNLADYKGQVVLIVNVASKCGATPQYEDLQTLYKEHKEAGLVVLGFPCNQFGAQEPGTSDDITSFCEANYGVEFPMFAKVEVNGPNAAPLFKYLTENAEDRGAVAWNFEKFLIGRDGQLVNRYRTSVRPSDGEVVSAIQAELQKG